MSAPQGTAWPNVLADLVAKRDALMQMIDIVCTHFVGADPTEMPESPIARSNGRPKTKAAATRTDRPTEQRSSHRRAPAPRSLPDGARGQAILATLKAHGPLAPGELAKRAKLGNIQRLRYHLKPMLKSGAVLATGATANRVISLPGTKPAKEHL